MNQLTVIDDKGLVTFGKLSGVYDVGISINDGLYLFVDSGRFNAVAIENGEMMVEQFYIKEEAMLWLLNFELWRRIYDEPEEVNYEK